MSYICVLLNATFLCNSVQYIMSLRTIFYLLSLAIFMMFSVDQMIFMTIPVEIEKKCSAKRHCFVIPTLPCFTAT